MKYVLDPTIIKEADKCRTNHSCLTTGIFGHPHYCQGSDIPGPGFVFLLNNGNKAACPYLDNDSTVHRCNCPVRHAILLQYGSPKQ